MSTRYLAWTLLIAACGLQAYLVHHGSIYFVERETFLPSWRYDFSAYLSKRHEGLPFAIVAILTLAIPSVAMLLSWLFLGSRRRSGWNLALAVDLFFALPSLGLISINLIQNLRVHRLGLQNNPEVLLFALALLHILVLSSPPVRALIFPHAAPEDPENGLLLPITSAR